MHQKTRSAKNCKTAELKFLLMINRKFKYKIVPYPANYSQNDLRPFDESDRVEISAAQTAAGLEMQNIFGPSRRVNG
uniref:Uncharacterized protein n=1 Tax=Romanomermis culicivorax TaxID=13658 RepID=A0A915IMH3_ROMCU